MEYQITIEGSKPQAKAVLALLKTLDGVSVRPVRSAGSKSAASRKTAKEAFLQSLREGIAEVKQIEAGGLEAKPLSKLLNGH